MARTIFLDRYKALKHNSIVGREEYLNKYKLEGSKVPRLLQGAPLIISVEGTYVLVNDLVDLCDSKVKYFVNNWVSQIKINGQPDTIIWRWNRK